MKKNIAPLFLALTLAACTIEGDILKLPEAWRLPDRQEATETWRNGLTHRGLNTEGDFDGNGAEDLAYMLESEKDKSLGVWVYLNGDKRNGILIDQESAMAVKSSGIRLVKPGTYPTPCGAAGNCAPDQPKEVAVAHDGIDLFANGGASVYLYWDAASKQFVKAAIGAAQ